MLCGRVTSCCLWIHGHKRKSPWLGNPPISPGRVSLPLPEIQDLCPPDNQDKCGSKWAMVGRHIWSPYVRREPNGLGNVLSWTQVFDIFSRLELPLLPPLEVLPVRVFSVCECIWQKLLPHLKILSEIGKISVESVSGNSADGQPPWKTCSSDEERKMALMTVWNQSSLNRRSKCWWQTALNQTPGWILQAENRQLTLWHD